MGLIRSELRMRTYSFQEHGVLVGGEEGERVSTVFQVAS